MFHLAGAPGTGVDGLAPGADLEIDTGHWLSPAVATGRDDLAGFDPFAGLFDQGFIMINTCSGTLSTAMGEAEIDRFAETLLDGLRLVSGRSKEDYPGDQI